jgi:hypothetical protein
MAGEFVNVKFTGLNELTRELAELAPALRRGPARRALTKGAEPVLAAAVAATPELANDVYRRGKLYRRKGTLRRALRIRSSKDTNKTGDVGVFVNIKPLAKSAVSTFKLDTGRRSSENPDDPFYWRFVPFVTRRNKNPKRFLTIAADATLTSKSLPIITDALKAFFDRLNAKRGKA